MRRLRSALLCSLVLALILVAGCAPTGDADDSAGTGADDTTQETIEVNIGVMPITAALPIFVAEETGLFEDAGLDANVEVFQSAADRNTALTAGAIDCTQGDPTSLFLLEAGEFPVSATYILLGATAEEGRHGIVAGPDTDAETLADLTGIPVGTSLNTHQEFCVDNLFAFEGFTGDDVVKEEVKKVPIRYELLMEGQIAAAALPEPWLTLAIHNGATLVASDTECDNISQVFLFASDEWLETDDGAEAMERLLGVLDEAATLINEDKDAWRDLLFERASVPTEIRDELYIDTYPVGAVPTQEMLDMQEDWMLQKGLLEEHIPYEDLVWVP